MKITVLGCGALGQHWLTALCKHGHEVQGLTPGAVAGEEEE